MNSIHGTFLFCLLFLLRTPPLFGQQASEIKVILTANSADLKESGDLFLMVDEYCQKTKVPVLWVLNGDVFAESFTEEKVDQWRKSAVEILDRHTHLSFVVNQGDREWNNSGKNGWKRVQQLEKIVKSGHPRLHLFFESGCPGPWVFSFSQYLDVITLNSQWYNHPYEKPMAYMNECDIADEDVFFEKLNDLLDESKNKNILLLSHFPVASFGKYGGRFPASSYLLPPLIGNALVSYRQNIGTSQDIVNDNFNGFGSKLDALFNDYSSLVLASGHEKNHSIFKTGNNFYINSGALTKGDFIRRSKQTTLATSRAGFIELTYNTQGEVKYQYFHLLHNRLVPETGDVLLKSPCSSPNDENSNTSYQPCASNAPSPQKTSQVYNPQEKIFAGPEYKVSKWKQMWFGKHYRYSWIVPVSVPYLNLDTTFQGLVINKKGGGRQTTSLKMSSGNGKEYVFRSVNKDPSKALTHSLRGTLVSDVIKDQTSTQQPYGALAASYLLDQIGILHARPELYVLPKDDGLGVFKEEYGNMLGMLEDFPSDKIQEDKIFGGADKIEKSYKLFQELYEDHDNRVDRFEFCRARVFDLLVGDWGKHEDNWKWAGYKKEGGEVFRPIPRDRDHVFSRWDGIFPFLADREWAKETGENFDYSIKGLRSLMHQGRHMDRLLGNQLTKADWINAAKEVQNSISDEDIDSAVGKMPNEIYSPDGKVIASKLKSRIKDLPYYAEKYYGMLAKEVDVVGSNKEEYFQATRNEDGSVSILVCDINKENKQPNFQKVFYQRKFVPDETKEIRLYGLTNNDIFVIKGESEKSILIRIISGGGTDIVSDSSYVEQGSKKTIIYQKDNRSATVLGKEAKIINPKDESMYHYKRTAFAYNTYFPLVLLNYNPFTGLALNAKVTFTNHNFSKPDFSTKHTIKGSVSTEGNYELGYQNQVRYLVGKWDGISELNLSRPLNYNYFFGIGNDTNSDDEVDSKYYNAQYNSILVSMGLMRDFWKRSQVAFSAAFESDEAVSRKQSFLSEHPEIFGVQKLDMINIKAVLNLDFRDDPFLPERGFLFKLNQEAVHIIDAQEKLASISSFEMTQYLSTYNKNPITIGVRAGGGFTTGELPFYRLFSLGQLNDLRGFKRNRYTGESKAFLNTELRWQILETENKLIPVKVGVRAFYDMGRVWVDSDPEEANYWHQGYGGGFYMAPFTNQFSINVSFGSSKEEQFLFMFGIGGFF